MRYTGLDKPKTKGYTYFWRFVFALTVAAVIAFLWYATTKVEYIWQWGRVPQYFWISEERDLNSEFDGRVIAVDESRIVLEDEDNIEREVALPKGAKVLLDAGSAVYYADTLARYHYSAPGILLEGLWITLQVSFLAIIIGIAVGILFGLARVSENPAPRWWSIIYVELIRGTPLMVQIFIWYFVVGVLVDELLAQAGLPRIPALWYGVIALAIFTGAYVAEIVRAGIQSVHRGQTEAARSLGMTYGQCMRKVVLPQALRRIMPPLAGQFISLIKDSSLLGVMAIRELTKATREAVTSSVQPLELWFTCAVLYLVLTFTLSIFVQYLERRAVRR